MLRDIIDGWKNYLFENNDIKLMAIQRATICANCPMAKKRFFERILPDYSIEKIQGMVCLECGCPLSTATRSPDKNCPLNKW